MRLKGVISTMRMKSAAKIISYNLYNENICASAAKISTTKGNAYEIFQKSNDTIRNREIIRRVLSSGHKSIIEHAVFTIALWNVSAYVEQFFIECRLASFTVKSRRYVDFSNFGYYIPPGLDGDRLRHYSEYMDMLFSAYKLMLGGGIPKEDARFILPYSFNSNFYCTINARELIHVLHAIKYGRGRGVVELENLANQIVAQIEELFPSLLPELDSFNDAYYNLGSNDNLKDMQDAATFIEWPDAGRVDLVQAPSQPKKILEKAHQISHSNPTYPLDFKTLLKSNRPRELEQLSYSFVIYDITLSGITHIVRHRMQSVIIPPLQSIGCGKFIIPETIKRNTDLMKRYNDILAKAEKMRKQAFEDSDLRKYRYYYILSGNMANIITTMNARELMLFIRLRSCNRAQWEIRNISIRMLKHLRVNFPELFNNIGPTCYISGNCPEGRLTCGKKDEIIDKFNHTL